MLVFGWMLLTVSDTLLLITVEVVRSTVAVPPARRLTTIVEPLRLAIVPLTPEPRKRPDGDGVGVGELDPVDEPAAAPPQAAATSATRTTGGRYHNDPGRFRRVRNPGTDIADSFVRRPPTGARWRQLEVNGGQLGARCRPVDAGVKVRPAGLTILQPMAPQPEALPLAGITVAVPATRRAQETAALVRRWGGEPLVAPLLQEVPVPDETRLRQATEAVIAAGPTWSVHLTGVGTRRWFERAEAWGLGLALTDCLRAAQLIPRGQKATAALAQSGLEPAWVPAGETSAEISAWLVP